MAAERSGIGPLDSRISARSRFPGHVEEAFGFQAKLPGSLESLFGFLELLDGFADGAVIRVKLKRWTMRPEVDDTRWALEAELTVSAS